MRCFAMARHLHAAPLDPLAVWSRCWLDISVTVAADRSTSFQEARRRRQAVLVGPGSVIRLAPGARRR